MVMRFSKLVAGGISTSIAVLALAATLVDAGGLSIARADKEAETLQFDPHDFDATVRWFEALFADYKAVLAKRNDLAAREAEKNLRAALASTVGSEVIWNFVIEDLNEKRCEVTLRPRCRTQDLKITAHPTKKHDPSRLRLSHDVEFEVHKDIDKETFLTLSPEGPLPVKARIHDIVFVKGIGHWTIRMVLASCQFPRPQ